MAGMISEKCSFMDFVEAVKDRDLLEMICLTDQEATKAERLAIKGYGIKDLDSTVCKQYCTELKSFILYLRHGVKKSNIKDVDLENMIIRDRWAL